MRILQFHTFLLFTRRFGIRRGGFVGPISFNSVCTTEEMVFPVSRFHDNRALQCLRLNIGVQVEICGWFVPCHVLTLRCVIFIYRFSLHYRDWTGRNSEKQRNQEQFAPNISIEICAPVSPVHPHLRRFGSNHRGLDCHICASGQEWRPFIRIYINRILWRYVKRLSVLFEEVNITACRNNAGTRSAPQIQ